jgi:hypothetical protein
MPWLLHPKEGGGGRKKRVPSAEEAGFQTYGSFALVIRNGISHWHLSPYFTKIKTKL